MGNPAQTMTASSSRPTDSRDRVCYLCGGQNLAPLIEVEGYSIIRCLHCGLGETLPNTTSEEDPAVLYDRSYLESQWTGADASPELVKRGVRANFSRVRRVRRPAHGKRLFEIGFGHGYFLEAARRRGFDVTGIDVSAASAEFCRSRFGLTVEVGSVADAAVGDGSLDVVVSWHVLEHLADPLEALRLARAWLVPGGIIAIEVPNYESYDAHVLGCEWEGWQPRYHRWHFTPSALHQAMRTAGFTMERRWNARSRTARQRLKRIPVVSLLRSALCHLYAGTATAAIARRNAEMSS